MYSTTDSFSTQSGELEHRTSKSRFTRTSHQKYTIQLVSIKRRQECIRRICTKLNAPPSNEVVLKEPACHHNVGISKNNPEELMSFMQHNSDDPAVNEFVPKLKAHLFPRIRDVHIAESEDDYAVAPSPLISQEASTRDSVFDLKYAPLNRFINRDMLLRYHWGFAVGHAYTHVKLTPEDTECAAVGPSASTSCAQNPGSVPVDLDLRSDSDLVQADDNDLDSLSEPGTDSDYSWGEDDSGSPDDDADDAEGSDGSSADYDSDFAEF
ncbi:hypothetical protein PAXINDRAFT_157475 [Paxillus involutus ATCC 200175]|uniref:Uncharacterized protein n=1 Tax=Paxillus involutus ATCC 200175 TaxID=664439 RepID=A0A0C9SS32_PAXIN|nr:hypothetical protein PAXINDRAFT_157475 [Paxillus involutus ATCC 200175]